MAIDKRAVCGSLCCMVRMTLLLCLVVGLLAICAPALHAQCAM